MRAVLRNLESSTTTTNKNKPSAFYDSEPPYAARVMISANLVTHTHKPPDSDMKW